MIANIIANRWVFWQDNEGFLLVGKYTEEVLISTLNLQNRLPTSKKAIVSFSFQCSVYEHRYANARDDTAKNSSSYDEST